MSIAEKLTQVAENIPKVYKAGQSSMVDESKLIPKTVSGNYISVDDVSEIPHNVGCKVESVNVLSYPYYHSTLEENGLVMTDNGDGTLTYNGTALNAGSHIFKYWIPGYRTPIKAGTYTLSGNPHNGGYLYIYLYKNQTDSAYASYFSISGKTATFTIEEDSYYGCYFSIFKGYSFNNVTLKPMLNRGIEALPYTPYVSPESVSVTRCGANLVTFGTAWNGTYSKIKTVTNADGTITVNGTASSLCQLISKDVLWLANTDIDVTVSFAESSKSGVQASIMLRDGNGVNLGTSYLTSSKTITIPSSCRKMSVSLYVTEGTTVENYTFYPMLNIGSAVTEYEPYNGQTLTPATDGTVEGMTSVSPHMNIFSDTEGVSVEVTYNKSYGMQTEWDRFWDVFQSNGKLTTYSHAFACGRWNNDTFKPKYDIKPTSAISMFAYNNNDNAGTNSNYCITDLSSCLERAGIILDTSKATAMTQMFYMGKGFVRIPSISFESCTELNATFYGCSSLQTIDKLIFKADGSNTFTKNTWDSPFGQCISLKNIVIEGLIGDSINFSPCPLTKDSITSVVNALSATATGQTLTLKLSAVNTAFETSAGAGDGSTSAEFAALVATKTNWTITMV